MLLFTKEISIGVSCFPVQPTTSILQFSYALSTFLLVDQTVDDSPCARDAHRSCSRKIGTPCGKRAVRTPTNYPASTDQATRLPEEGPGSWCFWPGWFWPGDRRSSSFSRRHFLRWHRELFRWFWKHKSKARASKPRLSPETISLIRR